MFSRCLLLQLIVIGSCAGEAESTISARLKAELKHGYAYKSEFEETPKPIFASEPVSEAEPMLYLAPIQVTAPRTFHDDLARATRQAAEAEKARKFSALSGGLIYSNRKGPREINLGIWPKLVPMVNGPMKKDVVGISVDILRMKW